MSNNILYSCIYFEKNIQIDHDLAHIDNKIINILLNKVNINENDRLSYIYEKFVFHLVIHNKLILLCATTNKCPNYIAFGYLDELKDVLLINCKILWSYSYSDTIPTNLYFIVKEHLYDLTDKYNAEDENTKTEEIKIQIDETKDIMLQNIDQIISKGEKLDLLIDKTDNLNAKSYIFKKRSVRLRRRMCCRSFGMTTLIILFVIAIIYVLLSFICGFDFSKCK